MALSFHCLILTAAQLAVFFVFRLTPAESATCNTCFTKSRATHYPNSDEAGTETGACGFGKFGAKINGGDVSAASQLFRDGVGCGACYQVRCSDAKYCSDKGVDVVITDHGEGDRTDFILSRHAFARMARSNNAAAFILSQGVVGVEYRRVSCSYSSRNMIFKIEEYSSYPWYLAFVIRYQQGKKDITAVQLCETKKLNCKLADRSYGAVWAVAAPPIGSLSIRMLVRSEENGEETWVISPNAMPHDWKAGDTYDSGMQLES